MSDIYEKFDTSLIRTFVFSKAIAIEENINEVSPIILSAAMLLSGPNIITEVLTEIKVDIGEFLKKIKKLMDKQSLSNKDGKIICCNIGFSIESKNILKSAVKIKNDNEDSILRIEYLLMALSTHKDVKDIFDFTDKDKIEKIIKTIRESNGEKEEDEKEDKSVGVGTNGKASNSKKKNAKDVLSFCIDLTEEAAKGKLDPIIGRDNEIEQIITVLCRKKKNNPILVGKPGVGKTAVAEGVAQRIVSKSVPKILLDNKLLLLNLSSVVADTQYRGQFEEKMTAIIRFFRENPKYICFIDEIHTMLGAGNSVGGLDAGNILKPSLARGDIKCIGATTEEEYTKHFQKDGALERRFQKVYIDEPSVIETIKILFGIKESIEKHHSCSISDEAIECAVKLSNIYVHDKNFPDKAIDLIDDACAKFVYRLNSESVIINKEHIARVISEQQRIPYEVVVSSDIDRIMKIDSLLRESIIGQESAIINISRVLKNVYVGIRDMSKPICTLLFAGSSGTGKTHTAEKLAQLLFSHEESLIRINLTEYSEPHSVAKLIGSPPGYVGFGEQNQLTDKVAKRPHCLILLDEIDKAHPDVLKIFMQIFSRGVLSDAKGKEVNFKQAIIILTTNNGFNNMSSGSIGFGEKRDESRLIKDKVVGVCKGMFGAEFVNRVSDFIIFSDLTYNDKIEIAKIMLKDLFLKIKENKDISITYDDNVLNQIVEISKLQHGLNANPIEEVIKRNVIPSIISDCIINSKGAEGDIHFLVDQQKNIIADFRARKAI